MRSLVGLSLALLVGIASKAWARSDLPNHTDVLVTVVADDDWLTYQGMSPDILKGLITKSIEDQATFSHGTLESTFTSMTTGSIMDEVTEGKFD